MKKFIGVLPMAALLTGCWESPMTREKQLVVYRSRCLDYGYPSGTREFADCMQAQEAREEELAVKHRKAAALEERNRIKEKNGRKNAPKSLKNGKVSPSMQADADIDWDEIFQKIVNAGGGQKQYYDVSPSYDPIKPQVKPHPKAAVVAPLPVAPIAAPLPAYPAEGHPAYEPIHYGAAQPAVPEYGVEGLPACELVNVNAEGIPPVVVSPPPVHAEGQPQLLEGTPINIESVQPPLLAHAEGQPQLSAYELVNVNAEGVPPPVVVPPPPAHAEGQSQLPAYELVNGDVEEDPVPRSPS